MLKVIQLINGTVYEHLIKFDAEANTWETSEMDEDHLLFHLFDDGEMVVEISAVVAVIPQEYDGSVKE